MDEYTKQAEDFLKETNTSLEIKFKEFNSMPWDEDGQKRNIFKCTLRTQLGQHEFDFGSSIVDSCPKIPEWDTLQDSDKIEFYAGLRWPESGVSSGLKFHLTKKEAQEVSSEFIEEKANEILEQAKKNFKEEADKRYKSRRFKLTGQRDIFARTADKHNDGAYIQCVQNAIKRRIEELKENVDHAKNIQLKEIKLPSEYDILACLSVFYFENPDEVYEMFGEMKPSRAFEIFREDQALQEIFTEDQIEKLNEVA